MKEETKISLGRSVAYGMLLSGFYVIGYIIGIVYACLWSV